MEKSVFLFPWKISNPAPLRNHRPGTSTTDRQATWSLAANWLLDRHGLLEKNSIVIVSKYAPPCSPSLKARHFSVCLTSKEQVLLESVWSQLCLPVWV